MNMSIVALSSVVVGFNALHDPFKIPMFENAVGQSVWVEMKKSGNMSAPVESKLCGPKVPRLMFGSYVGKPVLQDPIGPVEEVPMSYPSYLLTLSSFFF